MQNVFVLLPGFHNTYFIDTTQIFSSAIQCQREAQLFLGNRYCFSKTVDTSRQISCLWAMNFVCRLGQQTKGLQIYDARHLPAYCHFAYNHFAYKKTAILPTAVSPADVKSKLKPLWIRSVPLIVYLYVYIELKGIPFWNCSYKKSTTEHREHYTTWEIGIHRSEICTIYSMCLYTQQCTAD
jgi:hypothetical protein